MESVFLVNPRRKKKSRKGRMPAGLARYWAGRRGRKTSARKRRRKSSVTAVVRASNPRRKRRRARASNPRRRVRRHARRANPIFRKRRRGRSRARNPFTINGVKSALVPAAIGAGGAIALAIAYAYVSPKLPSSLTTGYLPAIVKIAGAIGLGMLASKFLGREDGKYVTMGALTVTLVGVVTPLITQAMPSLPGLSGLRGVGDYIPYSKPGMGAYMRNPALGRLGFVSPASVIQRGGGMGAYMANSVPGMKGLGAMHDLSGSGYDGLNS